MIVLSERWENRVVSRPFEAGFDEDYDVIVVGLGTAGAIAAIQAARLGLRVLGIERMHGMGGTGTFGGVVGYYFGSRGGLYEEIDKRAAELEASAFLKAGGVNALAKSIVLEQAAAEAGVEYIYEAIVIGVMMEGHIVKGVRWVGPEGLRHSSAKVVIDCSAEAEVCAMAGCEFRQGREIDGQAQPFSNVIQLLRNHMVSHYYTDSGYVDATQPEAMSRAIVESALLQTHLKPVYEESERLLKVVPQLGLREGRLIVGEDTVTFSGFVQDRYSREPLFYAYSNLDNHSKDIAFESEAQQDWSVVASLWGLNFKVPIPSGALIPRGTEGLLAAGRCISLDHDLAGCIRMKRDMQKCGEAAANLAYLSIRQSCSLKNVSYSQLRPMLEETGCIRRQEKVELKDSSIKVDDHDFMKVKWLTNKDEILYGLSGDKPGIAIWSAYRLGNTIKGQLCEWLFEAERGGDDHLARNIALALGLIGDEAAIPTLRQAVIERDMYLPHTSRKYNQVRGYAAIYLLGKLGDAGIVPELLRLMNDPAEIPNMEADERNWEFIADREELYFQFYSYSLMALLRIGDRHPKLRESIEEQIREQISKISPNMRISFKGSREIKYAMVDRIRLIAEKHLGMWTFG